MSQCCSCNVEKAAISHHSLRYNEPDSINMIRWQWKQEHYDVYRYYKGLIRFWHVAVNAWQAGIESLAEINADHVSVPSISLMVLFR